ncbi:MAG: hypothetical protein FWF59_12005 [Turicibacter sp.]|nr:hypothetical protein [Turicibacter sp.]
MALTKRPNVYKPQVIKRDRGNEDLDTSDFIPRILIVGEKMGQTVSGLTVYLAGTTVGVTILDGSYQNRMTQIEFYKNGVLLYDDKTFEELKELFLQQVTVADKGVYRVVVTYTGGVISQEFRLNGFFTVAESLIGESDVVKPTPKFIP